MISDVFVSTTGIFEILSLFPSFSFGGSFMAFPSFLLLSSQQILKQETPINPSQSCKTSWSSRRFDWTDGGLQLCREGNCCFYRWYRPQKSKHLKKHVWRCRSFETSFLPYFNGIFFWHIVKTQQRDLDPPTFWRFRWMRLKLWVLTAGSTSFVDLRKCDRLGSKLGTSDILRVRLLVARDSPLHEFDSF